MKTFSIILANLRTPRDVCYIMERNITKHYTYTLTTNDHGVINHGMSCDDEWRTGTWGNRLYRKAGGIPGWPQTLNDTSAAKMTELISRYLPEVKKDQVVITVNDYTQDLAGETDHEVERFLLNEENKLIRLYESHYGCLPQLNVQNTRAHPKPLFDIIFSEEQ